MKCIDCKVEFDASDAHLSKGQPCVSKGQLKANSETTDEIVRCNNCDTVIMKASSFFEDRDEFSFLELYKFMLSIPELNAECAKSFEMKLKQYLARTMSRSQVCVLGDDYPMSYLLEKRKAMPQLVHPKSYFEEKYKDRPDLLQKVLTSVPQLVHPDTKECMWYDTKVSHTDSTVHTEKKELEMQCAHEGAVNQPRTKRTAAMVENSGGEDGQPLEETAAGRP